MDTLLTESITDQTTEKEMQMSNEMVVRDEVEISLGQLTFSDPSAMVKQAEIVAGTLSGIIDKQGLFKQIGNNKYVKVEGWTTLGAMLGVVPRAVSVKEIRDGVFEATVELVRVSDGMVVGRGIAECGDPDEIDKYGNPTWADRATFAKKSMAQTRATGKAFRLSFSWIVTLAGYQPTPAEEMDGFGSGGNVSGADTFTQSPQEDQSHPSDPGKVLVPYKKAKQLNGGEKPTVEWLMKEDPEYCQWIISNLDGDVVDAIRAYVGLGAEPVINVDPETGEVIEGEVSPDDHLTEAEKTAIATLMQEEPALCPDHKLDWDTAWEAAKYLKLDRKEFMQLVAAHKGDVRIAMAFVRGYL